MAGAPAPTARLPGAHTALALLLEGASPCLIALRV